MLLARRADWSERSGPAGEKAAGAAEPWLAGAAGWVRSRGSLRSPARRCRPVVGRELESERATALQRSLVPLGTRGGCSRKSPQGTAVGVRG